jgi:hypothetical protein
MGGGDVSLDQWPILLEQWRRERDLLIVDPAVAVERREAQRTENLLFICAF